ncbi:hypothetical protein [Paenibacillus abyssi]|uniref:Spore protein n=1 Tax=Paenibacillus abyssi TaxID=1340531 RepID=A0A917G5S4_9BACL|nr:hypothetical protein [Paenibacillus abyssi]GGG24308.1 hypothetical protein GCM10010916_46030 [Paenibacillus abyssi]
MPANRNDQSKQGAAAAERRNNSGKQPEAEGFDKKLNGPNRPST